jgi:diguanylate cyclase (GGDEF)-like protein
MSLLAIASVVHVAGALALAFITGRVSRDDPRPYLQAWRSCWLAQAAAAGALALWASGAGRGLLSAALPLTIVLGGLLTAAAFVYATGRPLGLRGSTLLAAVAIAAAVGAPRFADERQLLAAPPAILGLAALAAAARLWPLREPGGLGLRVVCGGLVALALACAWNAAGFAGALPGATPHLGAAPLLILAIQTLVCLGLVLAVGEASHFAIATVTTQLDEARQRLKLLAETDRLTGCYNRQVFRELVDDVRARSHDAEGVLILIDLGGLESVNVREGHSSGDERIRALANAVRSRTRATDVLVRWEGGEFAVVIPGATRAEGEARRAEIVAGAAHAGLPVAAGLGSYGPHNDILAAVAEADRALRQFKEERRPAPA